MLRDVRALGQGYFGTAVFLYRMFKNTFCCKTFVRSDLRHHLESDLVPTVCTLVRVKGSNVSGYVACQRGAVCVRDGLHSTLFHFSSCNRHICGI